MSCNKLSVLVVGADGMIGRALLDRLKLSRAPVIGTTRRSGPLDENYIYLDLLQPEKSWKIPDSIGVAVICAGNRKVDECHHDPEETARVNVEGRYRLIKVLVKKKIFVIYISTSAVFDGKVPKRMHYESLSPVTEYGRQNAEVERKIIQWEDSIAILRVTKCLGPNFVLLDKWAKALKQNKAIHPFKAMSMAPVSLQCIVSVLQLLSEVRYPGIWQLSGSRDISYVEVARIGADFLQANQKLIQPISAPYSRHNTESLNMNRIRSFLGVESPNVVWLIKKVFEDLTSLQNNRE